MEILGILRTLGALAFVLGLLVGALWLVRRYDLRLPGAVLTRFGAGAAERRLEVIERLAIDPRRSVMILRRDNREFTLVVAPEGLLLLDPNSSDPVAELPATTADAAVAGEADDTEADLAKTHS